MIFSVLGSGSKGNSVYIESGTTAILIDAGFSGKQIESRLRSIGKDISSVKAVLLTHEHTDHIQGAGVLSRRLKIPLISNYGTLKGGETKLGKLPFIQEFQTGDALEFQNFAIRSFRLSHDTNDPVGYVVSDGTGKLGYCTDTGKVTHLMAQRLLNCDSVILEFNHDLEMLKLGPYPLPLQQRVRSAHGHLSNPDAADFLRNLENENLHTVVLAHLSEVNNLPLIALEEATSAAAKEGRKFVLARQDRPTELLSL